jgi:hypothetical protein
MHTNRPTATGIPEREFRALKAFLLRSTVPLVYEFGDRIGIRGSGCLYQHRDALFFVTAGHVLAGVDPLSLGIPLRQHDSEVYTVGRGVIGLSKDDDVDVAVYRIDDEDFAMKLRQGYLVLSAENVAHVSRESDHFVVAGFPHATIDRDGNTLKPRDLTQIHTLPYTGDVIGNRGPHDLFYQLKPTAADLWGNDRELPKLPGISGGPVWQVLDSDALIWTPESCLRLVALQVSCDPRNERYMRALTWEAVNVAIERLGR